MRKCKKDSNLDEVFEEMTKKAEKGISLAEQIVDLKSDHEHNLKLMKGLNDKIEVLERERLKNYKQLTKAKEILRSLYFIIQNRIDYKNNIGIADEMWRAEQFLKEIEK